MRYIDIATLELPTGWEKEVDDALIELKSKSPTQRSIYIDSMQKKTWKNDDLVQRLLHLVSKETIKCWYSEAHITGDPEIDHFRPKGKDLRKLFNNQYDNHLPREVLEQLDDNNNKGWWFLAFDYRNFRVCTCVSNQLRRDRLKPIENTSLKAKGKSHFFPLKKGSAVAINSEGLTDELNCLLDPCNPNDPEYLLHDNEGKIYTLYNNNTPDSSWIKCRVEASVAIYHLDSTHLTNARKHKWLECVRTVIEPIYQAYEVEKNAVKSIEIARHFYLNLHGKEREFSAVAIDCVKHYKSTYKFLNLFFPDSRLVK